MTTTVDRPTTRRPVAVGTAAVYSRVSTEDQVGGASLTTQRADCLRYCQSLGFLVVREYTDVQSGLKSDRVQYQEMLRDARNGEFDYIVVWKLDRFGRDRIESGIQLRELLKVGVRVDSATEPNDSPLLRNILMDFAEEVSRRISVRVSANKRTRAQEGRRTSKPPFGYSNVAHPQGGRTLEPNKDGPAVTEIFRMYASGRHSLADLRDYIGRASTSSKKPQTRSGVHLLLRNPAYVGVVRHAVWADSEIQVKSKAERLAEVFEVQSDYEPLIDRETFDKVQQRMQNNQHRRRGGPHSPFLFAGMIRCACGHRYTGHQIRGKITYYCGRKNDAGDCDGRSVNESRIRDAVISPMQGLMATLNQEDVRAAVRAEVQQQVDAASAAAQQGQDSLRETVQRLESRLSALEDAFLDGDITRDRYTFRRDEITAHIKESREQSTEHPHVDAPDIEYLLARADAIKVEDWDDSTWREIIEGMVEGIVIHGHAIEVCWKPEYAGLVDGN